MLKSAAGIVALALCAAGCSADAPKPVPIRGDVVMPGDVQVAGLTYCGASRLELVAVVLGKPPMGESLDLVKDANAPGCTWASLDGASQVRLNVYSFPTGLEREFDVRAAALARKHGQGQALDDIGLRAARFGYAPPRAQDGVVLVQTGFDILEFEARDVPAPKLAIFARSVAESFQNGYIEG